MANVHGEFRLNVSGLEGETQPIFRRAVNEIARDIEREAKRLCPVRTGHTRSTITAHPARVSGMTAEASVTARGAALMLHTGTRPHMIFARRARALHFWWDKAGGEVFFHHVHHPGTKPYPFMTIAAERVAARHR